MEDYLIGKSIQWNAVIKTVGPSAIELLSSSKDRVWVRIYPHPVGQLTVAHKDTVTANNGRALQTTSPPIEYRRDIHGDIVTQSFWGIAPIGGAPLLVEEGIIPGIDDYLMSQNLSFEAFKKSKVERK